MKAFDWKVFLVTGLLLQGVASFGFLRWLLSPPIENRLTRLRSTDNRRAFGPRDPFAVSDFVGLVQQHGYPAEEHNVTTQDGYHLVLHRIPSSPLSAKSKRKPVVFVQHGILASSDTWVLMGPKKDLAFQLADAGYDVWIGNIRGNTYCRSHMILSSSDPDFWQFSYDEIALYDIPSMIDYALGHSGRKTLIYIGHSMGSTMIFALLSMRPEYNDKVRLVIGLAPVAYWKHEFRGLQKVILDSSNEVLNAFQRTGVFELVPQSRSMARLGQTLCSDAAVTQPACLTFIFSLTGTDYSQLNASLIPYISAYFPAGGSLRTIIHYRQNIASGQFCRFDYGYIGNFAHYGQQDPPEYDLRKVTTSVALYYGLNDALSQQSDVKELENRLPNLVSSEPVSLKQFNHLDFLWARDARVLIYDQLLTLMDKFYVK